MGFSNKTAALFFFIFCLNLLISSHVASSKPNYYPTPTPPPPSTHAPPSNDSGPVTCIGTPSPSSGGAPTCPLTVVPSLSGCVDALNGGLSVVIGNGPRGLCCTLVQGLVDIEADLCLCAALKASALNVIPRISVKLVFPLLLSACRRNPSNAQCS